MSDKVVVTGLGTVNPIGLSVSETWNNAVNGFSGVGPITQFDASDLAVQAACEVKNFDPVNHIPAKELRRMDRYQHLALAASQEAIEQAGLLSTKMDFSRIGVIISSAIGGMRAFEEGMTALTVDGPRRISPFFIPKLMSNGASGLIAINNEFTGPNFSVASACASGADGIGVAWTLLRAGVVDVVVTGGSDATITQLGLAAFDKIGALSKKNPASNSVPKPFDLNRDGFVMGEGAAILVLESEKSAKERGANILAELAGYAGSADAYHITAPLENGTGGAQAMRQALEIAQINYDEVSYINAHGTATQLNDVSETKAIKLAFKDLANQIPISSTKSMTGHLIGATGALEAIMCVYAIRENVLPPTINYETPDPECDLDYVPNTAREHNTHVAISNAFGFGGHNTVLVVKEYS
jgi:beta-ketoacyl-acyl-carrier-protein synthase II